MAKEKESASGSVLIRVGEEKTAKQNILHTMEFLSEGTFVNIKRTDGEYDTAKGVDGSVGTGFLLN